MFDPHHVRGTGRHRRKRLGLPNVGLCHAFTARIHTVSATSSVCEVAMPSGYPFPRSVRWEFFDRVCRGQPVTQAARDLGVFRNTAWKWWGDASGMKLVKGRHAAGLAEPGDLDRPGGRGHRLSLDERIEIMRGRDAELSYAEIGRRIGRDRRWCCVKFGAIATLTGITMPGWPMPARRERPAGPRHSNWSIIRCLRRSRTGWAMGGAPS